MSSDTTTPYQIRNHPDFESQKQTYLEMQANGEIPTMSNTTTKQFRDHSQPCEHDRAGCYTEYVFPDDPDDETQVWKCEAIGCPGGRERKLDQNMVRGLRRLLRLYGHEDGLERALREWLVEVSDVEFVGATDEMGVVPDE